MKAMSTGMFTVEGEETSKFLPDKLIILALIILVIILISLRRTKIIIMKEK